MDLSKKADRVTGIRECHIKEEYVEEDVNVDDLKDELSSPNKSPGSTLSLTMSLPYSSPCLAGPLYPPLAGPCPPFYCPPISAFSLVSLPAPAPPYPSFRDLMENNQNGADHYKRKTSSKINEANKKLREGSTVSQGKLDLAKPIKEKEKDKPQDDSSGLYTLHTTSIKLFVIKATVSVSSEPVNSLFVCPHCT